LTAGHALPIRLSQMSINSDARHPPGNIARVPAGHMPGDADRIPWLTVVVALTNALIAATTPKVAICSALKRRHPHAIIGGRNGMRLIFTQEFACADGRPFRRAARACHAGNSAGKPVRHGRPSAHQEDTAVAPIDPQVAAIVEHIVTALSLQQASMTVPA
jgi:gluconokinase